MRIPGSYWWVMALMSCALGALAVVFPVYFLGAQMTQDLAAGTYGSFDALMGIVFGPFFALIFLAGSIYPGYFAAWSLACFRRRKRAINGDPDAMPLAYPPFSPVPAGQLPDLSIAPLTLRWRARRDLPLIISVFETTLSVLKVAPTLLFMGFLVWTLAQQTDKLAYFEANLFQFITLTVVSAVMVALYIILARMRRFQAKHSFGVTATSEGLDSIDELGRHAFIPWGEARLFEVDEPSRFGPRVSRLYSSHATVQWVHRVIFDSYLPDGASAQEMRQREIALAHIIIARTGLQPRALAKRLMAPPSATVVATPHTQSPL